MNEATNQIESSILELEANIRKTIQKSTREIIKARFTKYEDLPREIKDQIEQKNGIRKTAQCIRDWEDTRTANMMNQQVKELLGRSESLVLKRDLFLHARREGNRV